MIGRALDLSETGTGSTFGKAPVYRFCQRMAGAVARVGADEDRRHGPNRNL